MTQQEQLISDAARAEELIPIDELEQFAMNQNQMKIAEKILKGLESRQFFEWHEEGDFYNYITGENLPIPTKEEILRQIIRMFNLE